MMQVRLGKLVQRKLAEVRMRKNGAAMKIGRAWRSGRRKKKFREIVEMRYFASLKIQSLARSLDAKKTVYLLRLEKHAKGEMVTKIAARWKGLKDRKRAEKA